MENNRLMGVFQYLYPYRKYCLILAALCFFIIIYTFIVITPQQQNIFLVPTILGLLWMLIFYLAICIFQPTHISKSRLPLLQRLKLKFLNFFKVLLSIIFMLLTFAVVTFSFRLFNAMN